MKFFFGKYRLMIVNGNSMEDKLNAGDLILIKRISNPKKDLKRGDIIIYYSELLKDKALVKRLIGMPNEEIKIDGKGKIIVGDTDELNQMDQTIQTIQKLTGNEFYVLGDNRNDSFDSRRVGPIKSSQIKARVIKRVWPLRNKKQFIF